MSFDFQSNPELALARAQATTTRDRQLAQVKEARRQALINFGSADIARGVLGANDPTIAAISADPDKSNSVLAQLEKQNRQAVDQAEGGYSSGSNLWFSGARAKGLTDLAQEKVRQQADAEAQLRQALTGYTDQMGAAQEDYRNTIQGAQTGAYQDALNQALEYGIGPAPPPEAAPPGAGGPGAPPAAAPFRPPARARGMRKVAQAYAQKRTRRRSAVNQPNVQRAVRRAVRRRR